MGIKRIKYVSRHRTPLGRDEVDEIVRVSAKNNPKRDVTGAMMASGNVFFQILEGPPEAVDDLFDVIRRDPRHVDVVCLGIQEGCPTRLFAQWAMKRLVLEAHPRVAEIEARLHELVAEPTSEGMDDLARVLWSEPRAA